jgi:hypothetical protein
MRSSIVAIFSLLGIGCAHNAAVDTALPITPAPAVGTQEIPTMETVTSRLEAKSTACEVVRALDGRAICAGATVPSPAAATTTAPGPRSSSGNYDGDNHRALASGEYLVIGSFAERQNATNWANFNADFGTDVQRVPRRESTLYRVVIGPLEQDTTGPMREILAAVGAGTSWRLAVCTHSGVPTDAACTLLGSEKLADATTP